eukprot:6200277-Pleurochrysis_carterae.AAC.2
METLRPCTQLYISIDAPTKEQLKAVDRPLFLDFWARATPISHACQTRTRAPARRRPSHTLRIARQRHVIHLNCSAAGVIRAAVVSNEMVTTLPPPNISSIAHLAFSVL